MQVGISSAVFYPEMLETSVDNICRLGFKKAEIFINCESEFDNGFIDSIKDRMDDAGVEVVSVHPYTSLMEGMLFFTPYPRRVDDAIAQYRKYFSAAKRLGAKYFTLHGDRTFSGTVMAEVSYDTAIGILRRLAAAAEDCGVMLTQENVSWCSSASLEYLAAIKEAVGDKLGFTLDIKQARRAGVDPSEYIRVMGGALKNIHVSDFSASEPCLLPGAGMADFRKLRSQLESVGYSGDLLIEVYSSNYSSCDELLSAKKYLEGFFETV